MTATPQQDVDRMVDEGVLIVAAGLRLQAKNRLIVDVLAHGGDFDRSALTTDVRDELATIADAKRAGAETLLEQAERAAQRTGLPDHGSDYRRRDVDGLRLRSRVDDALADVLEHLVRDGRIVDEIVEAARAGALADIVQPRLTVASAPLASEDPRARSARRARIARDLSVLAAARGVRQAPPARRRRRWPWSRREA